MSDAAERKRKREATWTSRLFRGDGVHEALESDAEAEWARLSPTCTPWTRSAKK